MTTQEIINDMRSHTITSMRTAADRLEELQLERDDLQLRNEIKSAAFNACVEAKAEKKRTNLINY